MAGVQAFCRSQVIVTENSFVKCSRGEISRGEVSPGEVSHTEVSVAEVSLDEVYPYSLIPFPPGIPALSPLLQERKVFFVRHCMAITERM